MIKILNKEETLGVLSEGRKNNLNFIRFIAAVMVIFGHSYAATLSYKMGDPICRLTKNQLDFGGLAVSIFFVYGGFLIAKSMERLKETKKYFKARIIRIFPPLIFVTFVATFIMGPLVTVLPLSRYFSDYATYRYLLNSLMILIHDLPGVFIDNINTSVNGPLWTLPVEFSCYIMCYFFYKLKLLDEKIAKYTVIPAIIFYYIMYVSLSDMPIIREALRPIMLFYVGMIYYVYRNKVKFEYKYLIISLIFLIVGSVADIMQFAIIVFLPYILFCIGYGTTRKLEHFGEKMEISYGIYLFGWPVQQCVVFFLGKETLPLIVFIIAVPIAIICGVITFNLVEKPITLWAKGSKE